MNGSASEKHAATCVCLTFAACAVHARITFRDARFVQTKPDALNYSADCNPSGPSTSGAGAVGASFLRAGGLAVDALR